MNSPYPLKQEKHALRNKSVNESTYALARARVELAGEIGVDAARRQNA